jgi:hypothetical protein
MQTPVGAIIRLGFCIAIVSVGVILNWQESAYCTRKLPLLRVVTARPLAADKEIERADVELELLLWADPGVPRIGRVQKVIGLPIKQALAAGAALTWANLEPAKKPAK